MNHYMKIILSETNCYLDNVIILILKNQFKKYLMIEK